MMRRTLAVPPAVALAMSGAGIALADGPGSGCP
jgi:hypothetical protein